MPTISEQSYPWGTATQGPGCLPRLVELMKWYSANSLHNFQYAWYSVNTAKAQGHYLLNQLFCLGRALGHRGELNRWIGPN
jgi:hypothetical protein